MGGKGEDEHVVWEMGDVDKRKEVRCEVWDEPKGLLNKARGMAACMGATRILEMMSFAMEDSGTWSCSAATRSCPASTARREGGTQLRARCSELATLQHVRQQPDQGAVEGGMAGAGAVVPQGCGVAGRVTQDDPGRGPERHGRELVPPGQRELAGSRLQGEG
eukprot:653374-Hanusia_phi.AAC.1